MRDCPKELADVVVANGGPRPTMWYSLDGHFSFTGAGRNSDDGCIDFFQVYTNSGFDPNVGREDDLGNGTSRCGVIPMRVSAATFERDPVAALLKGGTNIFVGFVFDNEDGSQDIAHILDEEYTDDDGVWHWENPDGWCEHCGVPTCDEFDQHYSDGVTERAICERCWNELGYEHCYECGEDYAPDMVEHEGSYVPDEGWMCNYCFAGRYPDRAEQWDDLEDADKDRYHDVGLVVHELWSNERNGQQKMEV